MALMMDFKVGQHTFYFDFGEWSESIGVSRIVDIDDPTFRSAFKEAQSIYTKLRAVAFLKHEAGTYYLDHPGALKNRLYNVSDSDLQGILDVHAYANTQDAIGVTEAMHFYAAYAKKEIDRRANKAAEEKRKAERQEAKARQTQSTPLIDPDNLAPGYVYLIQSPSGAYKIGRTRHPENRMKTFGIQLPFEVEYICLIPTENARDLEKQLQARFTEENKHINGEWFALESKDVDYIKSLAVQS